MVRHGVCEGTTGFFSKSSSGATVLDEIPLNIQDVSDAQQLVEPGPNHPNLLQRRRRFCSLMVSEAWLQYWFRLVLRTFVVPADDDFHEKEYADKASYRKWAFNLADYFSKRFFRVYPLFAVVVFIVWLLPFEEKKQYFLVKERGHFDLFKVLTFSFPHRYFVLWTLPLEISYYFCLPVFVLGVLNLRRFWWVPFIPLYMWIIYTGWHERRSSHSHLMPHFPTFLAGSMAATLFVKLDTWMKATGFEFSKLQRLAIRAVEYAATALVLSVCFRRNSAPGSPAEPTMFFHWVHNKEHDDGGFSFISVPVTLVIVVEMLLPSCISAMFEWSVLRYWGKISFSVYLLHSFVVFSDIYGKDPSMYYDRFFLRFGLILLLCSASYHLVEYPSQLLAQRITRARSKGSRQYNLPVRHEVSVLPSSTHHDPDCLKQIA